MEEGGYFSTYSGIITDISDPLFLGRVKARVPAIADDFTTEWLFPAGFMTGVGSGTYWPPDLNAKIEVMFKEGDPEFGVYGGGFYSAPEGESELPTEFQREVPTNRGWKTPGAHLFEWDDLEESAGIRTTSAKLFKFHIDDKNCKIFMETPGGHQFVLDDKNKVGLLNIIDDFNIFIDNNDE